jgi:hypothetical protein
MDLTGYTPLNARIPIRGNRISLFIPVSYDPQSYNLYEGTFDSSDATNVYFMTIPPVSHTLKHSRLVEKRDTKARAIYIFNRNALWRDLDAGPTTPYVLDGGRKYIKSRKQSRHTRRKSKKVKS